MKKMSLEETQNCCLGILRDFDAFCSSERLKYWLIGGSTLGAVRHQGIIPWDDDIDVGMPRVDYERFCATYPEDGDFEVLLLGRTEGYLNPFAKMCDRRTLFDEPTSAGGRHGVFIDVFPIDYVCDSDADIRKALDQKRFYNHSFTTNLDAQKFKDEPIPKRIARKLLRLRYLNKDPVALSTQITQSVASDRPTSRMMNIWGAWGEREVMEADWFGEGVKVPFGDMECPVPSQWDPYLEKLYGDYMKPPADPPHYHGCAYWLEDEKEG